MKITIIRITVLTLLGITFFAIFTFSNQNGEESGGLSREIARKIINLCPYTDDLSQEEKEIIVEQSQLIIRKGAHFSIYMVVGILITIFISTYKVKLLTKLAVSIGTRINICNFR